MKICSCCKQELEYCFYYKSKQTKDGYYCYCKSCSKIIRKKYIKSLPPKDKPVDTGIRKCSRCQLEKEYKFFSIFPETGKPRGSWCKDCTNMHCKERNLSLGKTIKKPRRYDLIEQGLKQCYICDQVLSISSFGNHKRGLGGLQSYCKDCKNKKDTKRNKEDPLFREKIKRRHANNPNYAISNLICSAKRRLKQKQLDTGNVTKEIIKSLYEKTICTYCKKITHRNKRSIDHIIPIAKNGLHDPSNLVMCCKSCNSRKKDRDLDVFLKDLEDKI